jgi:phosphatidate cytidylyltransferase
MPQDRGLFILEGGLALLVMISLGLEAVRPDRSPLKNLPVTWLAVLYVGWLFSFALRMRVMDQTPITRLANVTRITGEGAWLVLYTQLVVSAADTGAYLVGRAIGRHKMAPAVSPGKTWEGAAGGFVAAVAVAWFGGGFLGLPPVMSGVSGVALGLLAPLGDLAKSAMKREVGIKDFGNLIPGHGGVLDRFDSLLFSAPLVYLLARFWA